MGDKHEADRPTSPAVRRALKSFADRLKELRKAAGLSQTQLGDRIYAHWTSIFRYENGQIPTLKIALMLAEALGTTIDGLSEQKPPRPRKEE